MYHPYGPVPKRMTVSPCFQPLARALYPNVEIVSPSEGEEEETYQAPHSSWQSPYPAAPNPNPPLVWSELWNGVWPNPVVPVNPNPQPQAPQPNPLDNQGTWWNNKRWKNPPSLQGWLLIQGWWEWGAVLSWHAQRSRFLKPDALFWMCWQWSKDEDGKWAVNLLRMDEILGNEYYRIEDWQIHEGG